MARVFVVQQQLPKYRMPLFDKVSKHFGSRFRVFYSPGTLGSLTEKVSVEWGDELGAVKTLPGGFEWQRGMATLDIKEDDVVVLWGNPRHVSTLALLLRAKFVGSKVIWWGHYWSSTSRRWRQILRFLPMTLADALLFYTDEEIEIFRQDGYNWNRRKVVAALNNGLDIAPIVPHRSPYVASSRERSLLFIGRLTDKAELGLGLRALALLGQDAPNLHVIGDGKNLRQLQTEAEQLGVKEKVIWHGSIVDEKEISAIANRCQAFLYPGEVGLSLVHAMAYGLPALVHEIRMRHMPEIAAFQNEETGIEFAWSDADSLADTIKTLLSDDDQLERMSGNALNVVDNSFNMDDMAARFIKLVDCLECRSVPR